MRWLDSLPDTVDRFGLSKLRETVKDRGACCATAHGATKSHTQLSS